MQRNQFRHFLQDAVRWGDCDPLGHLNNANYLRMIESARIDYFLKVMEVSLEPNSPEGWVLLDINCRFLGQVHFPCDISIGSRITQVGNSSCKMEAAFFLDSSQDPVFTSVVTNVWCNYHQGRSARIPDAVRAAVKAYDIEVEGL